MKHVLFTLATLLTISLLTFGRGADKPTLAGKWHIVLNTQGGDRENDSLFEVADDKITGKWDLSNPQPPAIKGTITDGHFSIEVALESTEIGPGTMKLTGQLADDGTLMGDWAFSDYNGSFKGTRVK